jgi:hypothetical protein
VRSSRRYLSVGTSSRRRPQPLLRTERAVGVAFLQTVLCFPG